MSVPAYLAYKDSGVDWIGDIPNGWAVKPLKRAAVLLTQRAEERTFAVALENIESWSGRFIEVDGTYEGDGTAFATGDILFGKLRPYLAKAWLANRGGEAVGDFHVLRCTDQHRPEFIHKVILSTEVISLIDGSTFGAKMPRASWDFMGTLPIPVPPLAEQSAVAAFLDRETGKIDALVAEQERLMALLKEKRQAVISQAVTKGLNPDAPMKDSGVEWLGDVPSHWNVAPLGRVAIERCDGPFGSGLKSEHYTDEGVRVIRLQNIRRGYFDASDAAFIDNSYYETNLSGHDVRGGDLLIAGLGDERNTVGRACVAPFAIGPAMVKADCFRFRLDVCRVLPDFAAMQLTAGSDFDAGVLSSGSTRSRIPLSEMATRRIALPTVNEQMEIARFAKAYSEQFDALTTDAERAITLLKERRAVLISAAVTGKIDVRGLVPEAPEAA